MTEIKGTEALPPLVPTYRYCSQNSFGSPYNPHLGVVINDAKLIVCMSSTFGRVSLKSGQTQNAFCVGNYP